MFLQLTVDAAYSFDFLSILEVKFDKSTRSQKLILDDKLTFYSNEISEQIGDEKFQEIKNSREYIKLKDANLKLFELIDNCKKININAQAVDQYNYRRWQVKDELQKKFFGKSVSELKLGYRENEN